MPDFCKNWTFKNEKKALTNLDNVNIAERLKFRFERNKNICYIIDILSVKIAYIEKKRKKG